MEGTMTPPHTELPKPTFADWMLELRRLGKKHNWPVHDDAPWLDYYNSDYSPEAALKEDMS